MIYKMYTFQYEANQFLYGLGKGHQPCRYQTSRQRKYREVEFHLINRTSSYSMSVVEAMFTNDLGKNVNSTVIESSSFYPLDRHFKLAKSLPNSLE